MRYLLVCLCALVASPVGAAEYKKTADYGPVTVTLRLDKTAVALSADEIRLTLTVEGPAENLDWETPHVTPADVWKDPVVAPPPKDKGPWVRVVHLVPWRAGEQVVQPSPLHFRKGPDGEAVTHTWESIPVRVTSLVGTAPEEASLKNLRDITPIEPVPAPPEEFPYLLVGGIAVGGLLIAGGIGWRLRRMTLPPVPEPTPAEWALAELDRIDVLDLPAEHEVDRFHTLISDVLRRYLERRFGLPATGQTTTEFLEGLRRSTRLTPEQQETLRTFLGQCDLAKFARADYTPVECKQLGRTAREFVRQTAKAPAEANGQAATTT